MASTLILFLMGCAETDLPRKAGADQYDLEKATHECYGRQSGTEGPAPTRIQLEECMERKEWGPLPHCLTNGLAMSFGELRALS